MARPPRDWISLSEATALFAAANIRVSRSTLARWAHSGRLQSVQPGRLIYVRRSEVRALLRPSRPAAEHRDGQPVLFDDWGS